MVGPCCLSETEKVESLGRELENNSGTDTASPLTASPLTPPEEPQSPAADASPPDGSSGDDQGQHRDEEPALTKTIDQWLAAAGALCLTMPTYGLMSAWGLFQVYWEAHQLRDGRASPTAIAWIGSLLGFLSCLFGLASGVVLDGDNHRRRAGVCVLLPLACAVYWASFLALAWCGTYAQFMACFVVAGISAAVPTTAAFVVVEQRFAATANRTAAIGLVSTGAPLGGLLVSLALRALFARHDWQVAMFWLSSMIGALVLVGCILVIRSSGGKSRSSSSSSSRSITLDAANPIEVMAINVTAHRQNDRSCADGSPAPVAAPVVAAEVPHAEKNQASATPVASTPGSVMSSMQQPVTATTGWRDLSHFADRGFLLFTACVFVFEFVLYTQWGSLPYFAALTGLGDVFYLQMTYNPGAIPGRTIPSWLAARWGPFDVTLAMTAVTILTVFVVWVPFGDRSAIALYIAAFLMGIGTGSFVPLSATCISHLCDGRGYGKWLGSCYAVVGFASLIGNPVNQALLKSTGPQFSVAFQGILLVFAFLFCVVVRRDYRRHCCSSRITSRI